MPFLQGNRRKIRLSHPLVTKNNSRTKGFSLCPAAGSIFFGDGLKAVLFFEALQIRIAPDQHYFLKPPGGNLPEARHALSMIVSRKTDNLPEEQIVRGAIESLGENLIDGVYSAFFWAIAGFMLSGGSLLWAAVSAVFLRAINTLDACWGYKDEKYLFFGRTAARTDDLLHWIP